MKTPATTVCRITIGTIMINSARAYRPVGIQPLKALPSLPFAAETRPAAERIRVRPVSSVLIGIWTSGRCDQAVADAAHRLQEQRACRIALDLAAQPVDLHVDGALVDAAIAGQRPARHGLAGGDRQDPQHLALAVGEMDDVLALAQLAAAEMIDIRPERDLLDRLGGRRRR